MRRQITKLQEISKKCIFLLFLFLLSSSSIASSWRTLTDGIDYKDLGPPFLSTWSHVHVFRIDLNKNQLDSLLASQLALPLASAAEFADYKKALIALNGGFFDQKNRPLGLRISQHQQKNPLKNISWWGVFYIKNNHAFISSPKHFKQDKEIDFALQSGPRLLIKGKIPKLKPGIAERSALGISKDGKLIILVTENKPMTTEELAHLMQNNPLNCDQALNLDGGSSSQLRAKMKNFQVNALGFGKVSDAIVVNPVTVSNKNNTKL